MSVAGANFGRIPKEMSEMSDSRRGMSDAQRDKQGMHSRPVMKRSGILAHLARHLTLTGGYSGTCTEQIRLARKHKANIVNLWHANVLNFRALPKEYLTC